MCCILGTDFIGNGHWLINRKYASNRKKFETADQAKQFVKDLPEILEKKETLETLVKRHSKGVELKPCSISDICIGKGVLIDVDGELRALIASYCNLLKQIIGKNDNIVANDSIVVAYDADGDIGLVMNTYNLGDLLTSVRNRNIVKLLAKEMGV